MKLVELEDTSWFPQVLRDQQLGYIGWLVQFLDIYRPSIPIINQGIAHSRSTEIVDLCSGSGEPMLSLHTDFKSDIPIHLSDLYPPEQLPDVYKDLYIKTSTDVMNMSFSAKTFYTMFNAFHHFDNEEQLDIIERMKTSGACFVFVEILEPTFFVLINTIIANTLGQIVLAPFVKPFSKLRLLFTYILPINLFTTTYDGIISVLRSKNKKQYHSLLSKYDDSSYCIQIQKCEAPFFNSIVIIQGRPAIPLELI